MFIQARAARNNMALQNASASQSFLPIREIRDSVVVLVDGGMRMVLMASSLNFALKSQDEQMALLIQFQNFVNALDFHVEFFIQSRRLDIQPYLRILEDRMKEQTNDLVKIQTKEYLDFVKNFTESTNVMSKSFFVVVPYSPPIVEIQRGVFGKLFGGRSKKTEMESAAADSFEKHRSQLEQRSYVVAQSLASLGVRSVILGTEELVELYYKLFNPGEKDAPQEGSYTNNEAV
ncbi:MAG: hypothetical protein A2569_01265 [Candidatus Vogelbacteria bacterium RIFOXYD1_FULL_51_18]|uniref:TraC-like domain-containing protein n=1 Tax=Candidatus Vogelbacteria bacterium RIFOXYD1_FULL_51_18 TaxID=1802440 RepID=A0A1G2QIL2_9BACT|nr:MAG: hypothetical protein A2569_01265 [Candidatus Vogelbacteria bacterium RIFOXYD1_FULL_51_18]